MNLDQTDISMKEFCRALDEFHRSLRVMNSALEDAEAEVKRVWDDRAYKEFQRLRSPFEENLTTYLTVDAPKFHSFIHSRLRHLARYLNGG